MIWLAPLAVFVLSLAVTGALSAYVWRSIDLRDQGRFNSEVSRTVTAMQERIQMTIALLDGTAGLFAASDAVNSSEFAAFVGRLQLRERYPGILGIGFSRRVAPAEVQQLEREMKAQQGPDFHVWPEGRRDEYHSIVFLEPLDERNLAAIGYDMFSEPTRRAAMLAARDSGMPRASAKVTLVQEIDPSKQAGFLIYLPVYDSGGVPGEVQARRELLSGFVYSPLRVGDLLGGVRGGSNQVDFELFDGGRAVPAALMRSTRDGEPAEPRFVAERTLEVAGRPWLVRFGSRPEFESLSHRGLLPWLVLVALAGSALLSWITFVLARAHRDAEAAAAAQHEATQRDIAERQRHEAEIRASEERERERSKRLEQLAAELREADRRKDEFLATLAHELRNPLAPLRTSLEIIRRLPDGPPAQRALDVAERQMRHMVRLIDDLLDLSRISRGTIVLQHEPVPLAHAIEVAVETSRPLIEARRHHLVVEPIDPELTVMGDATRLAQVFSNLLNNAANYTDPGGSIRVQVRSEPHFAHVSVRDSGIGMEPELLPQVFEMFRQAERSRERSGGLGIGLTLVRSLVEMHGGTVVAHSEGPGQGSEFVVCLPLVERAAARTALDTPAAGSRGVPPSKVLVVDDNRDAAQSLGVMLEDEGHHVAVAHDGLQALDAAREFAPDVVLLDIGMPGLDGYEVARRLRRGARGDCMRLIAITGWGQQDDRRRAQEAGFDLHMVKPVDFATLAGHMRRLTGR